MGAMTPLSRPAAIEAIVALENSAPDMLFACVPGSDIPLWPLMRWPVATAMTNAELGWTTVRRRVPPLRTELLRLSQLLPHPRVSRRARQADHLFFVSGDRMIPAINGKRNNVVEEHAELLHSVIMLMDRAIPRVSAPAQKPAFHHAYSYYDLTARTRLRTRLAPPPEMTIDGALRVAREIIAALDFEVPEHGVRSVLSTLTARVREAVHLRNEFERLIARVSPRVAYVHLASYGGDRSILVRALTEHGVHVAEHQHGWIGGAHPSYQFGTAAWEAPFRRTLPKTLLTFGSYWSNAVQGPFETVEVGKPLLEGARRAARDAERRADEVLVPSSVSDPDETTRNALRLRDALPAGWSVAFRPHPSERASLTERYPALIDTDRVRIDLEPDVGTTLSSVRAVYGVASTVLYEALALGCKVAVRRTPFTDYYIDESRMPVFDDDDPIDALVEALVAPTCQAHRTDDLFAADPLERMRDFSSRASAQP